MEVKQRTRAKTAAATEAAGKSRSQSQEKVKPEQQRTEKKISSDTPTSSQEAQPQTQIFPKHRVWSRIVLVLGVLTVVYFTSNKTKESIFGEFKEDLSRGKGFDVKCTFKYTDVLKNYPGITPENCGRLIVDQVLLSTDPFLHVIKQIMSKHFRNQPPPIVVIDVGRWTLNSYKELTGTGESEFLDLNNYIPVTKDFTDSFKLVHRRLKQVIRDHYKIDALKLHVAAPSFITIMTGRQQDGFDYASHFNIDQELNNGSYHYSTKIFLSDHVKNDGGGRFVFSDKDNIHRIVHPKKGRAVLYTSGPENIYFLDPPPKKQRSLMVLTIGFTGNPKQALRNRNFLE